MTATSYCRENYIFQTFLYLCLYFLGFLLILHIINLCGPLNKIVEKLGLDCYHYWMTYELNYRRNIPKPPRKCRCIKINLTRLEEPNGRNNGYLQKLGAGSNYSMGSNGGYFTCLPLPAGLVEDFCYYLFNNHGFLSTFCAEKDNPYSRTERNFAFFGLGCLTFFGNLIAQIIRLSDTEGAAWDIVFIGFLNFLLTNVFEVLFSCTFLFHATDAHRNETILHFYCRRFISWIGSVLGILLALGIGLFLLLVSSGVCGGRGENLLSFTLTSQLVGIGLDFLFIFAQYTPLVIHVKDLPCVGSKTLCGAWYRERYLSHFYQRPETFFVNPTHQNKHQYREKKGSISGAPVYAHEAVPEVQLRASALDSRGGAAGEGGGAACSSGGGAPTNFCYIQINFCKWCCCSCVCCPYPTCTLTRDDEDCAANLVDKDSNRGKPSDAPAEGFSVFDVYG